METNDTSLSAKIKQSPRVQKALSEVPAAGQAFAALALRDLDLVLAGQLAAHAPPRGVKKQRPPRLYEVDLPRQNRCTIRRTTII